MSLVGCRWSNALLKFRLALQPTSHAPRAGRDDRNDHQRHHGHVSIHAPRAGRDGARFRLPATDQVSIHAPRAGRDHLHPVQPHAQASFNPRAPRGARPSFCKSFCGVMQSNTQRERCYLCNCQRANPAPWSHNSCSTRWLPSARTSRGFDERLGFAHIKK